MRRPYLALLLVASALSLAPATRASGEVSPRPIVEVVKVQGVIDPALSDYVRGTIEAAERAGGATVVLQIDSRGAYGDEGVRLGAFIRGASVPVIAWIGPAGARAEGGALFLVYSSSLAVMAPGAGIGPALPFDLSVTASRERRSEVRRETAALADLARGAGAGPQGIARLVGAALPAAPALASGAVALVAPRPGEPADVPGLLRALDGRTVESNGGPVTLATVGRSGRPVEVRFHEIGPVRRLLHAVSTPTAVYVLMILGLWGIAFELTQSGIGVAGLAGVLALALAGYGLTVVPVHLLGLAVLLAGVGLQGADVLIRRVGPLTVAGTLAFGAGSILSWYGVAPAVDLSPWLVFPATIAGGLYFGFALTVALKARERVTRAQVGLVGLIGEARSDLDPEGGVSVKGTLWRARTSDGRIPKGTRVRVRGIDGLILRVDREPD